jgi:uncharacterized protein (DUF362 family)
MSVAISHAPDYTMPSVREALARVFALLGYPADNPLSGLITPGDKVFIKPNWVAHQYRASCRVQDDVYSTITHPHVIRAVAELVAKALNGQGEIKIGDNPSIDADFEALLRLAQLQDLERSLGVPCSLLDLRPLRCVELKDYGIKERMTPQPGDPEGSVAIDMGRRSYLQGVNPRLFRGVFSDRSETIAAHSGDTHIYEFSRSIVSADVLISIPKLKTHHKVGTTLNIKGLVGCVSNKNGLVHWRQGFPGVGGDAYPSFGAWLHGLRERVKKRGAWSGNDTIWRMAADLYNVLQGHGPKRRFSIIDGIRAGEGNGPFCPRGKLAQTLIAGTDFLDVDCVATRLMGFDCLQVPYLRQLLREHARELKHIQVLSDRPEQALGLWDNAQRHLDFVPPDGWPELRGA